MVDTYIFTSDFLWYLIMQIGLFEEERKNLKTCPYEVSVVGCLEGFFL